MDDRMTETLRPDEADDDPSYDLDGYEYEERRGPNILWGRIAILGIGLLLAFFLGRATAGGGVDEEQLTQVRADLEQAEAENQRLSDELAAAEAEPEVVETPAPEATEAEASEEEGAGDATDPVGETEGETYVVQKGDTLRGIAQTFCGDAQLDDAIAAQNGIEDATQLAVGQSLTLPPECTG